MIGLCVHNQKRYIYVYTYSQPHVKLIPLYFVNCTATVISVSLSLSLSLNNKKINALNFLQSDALNTQTLKKAFKTHYQIRE